MRKFIRFDDGESHEISPLSYEEFMSIDLWSGASDMAFAAWLRHNKFVEVRDYNDEALESSVIEINYRDIPKIEMNPSGDGESWIELPWDKLTIGQSALKKPQG